DSDEALHLVATSYYRQGSQATILCPSCTWLEESETVLTGGSVLHPKTVDDLATEYGDLACFALQLLGSSVLELNVS
ncbi:Cell division cycle protein 27-like 2, partial [Homarus americanus]